ncbi:MerR family transcriptional regulator [Nocardioides jensenii]|uniref:hypothetical protein n=1 Tax=Nocardioides jensenii TaxID=1843 RepID=UPI000831D845|nr:hypothetical protein [Nocardioides jensenii]
MTDTDLLTPEQAVEQRLLPFGNADWIRAQLRAGKLRGSKVAGRWLVSKEAIAEMVDAGTNTTRRRRRRAKAKA